MLLRVTVTLDTFKESLQPFAPRLETVFSWPLTKWLKAVIQRVPGRLHGGFVITRLVPASSIIRRVPATSSLPRLSVLVRNMGHSECTKCLCEYLTCTKLVSLCRLTVKALSSFYFLSFLDLQHSRIVSVAVRRLTHPVALGSLVSSSLMQPLQSCSDPLVGPREPPNVTPSASRDC